MSSIFKWSLMHKATISDVKEVLALLDFESVKNRHNLYAMKISAGTYWREMKVRLHPEEVVCFFLKEEEETTETYFEYLIKAGYYMGQIAAKLELLPVKGDDADELDIGDPDDEDDEELSEGAE